MFASVDRYDGRSDSEVFSGVPVMLLDVGQDAVLRGHHGRLGHAPGELRGELLDGPVATIAPVTKWVRV
jgi:hypothetical protein